jgi:hypothetical protein
VLLRSPTARLRALSLLSQARQFCNPPRLLSSCLRLNLSLLLSLSPLRLTPRSMRPFLWFLNHQSLLLSLNNLSLLCPRHNPNNLNPPHQLRLPPTPRPRPLHPRHPQHHLPQRPHLRRPLLLKPHQRRFLQLFNPARLLQYLLRLVTRPPQFLPPTLFPQWLSRPATLLLPTLPRSP